MDMKQNALEQYKAFETAPISTHHKGIDTSISIEQVTISRTPFSVTQQFVNDFLAKTNTTSRIILAKDHNTNFKHHVW